MNSSTAEISFPTLLFLIFLVLKLTGHIDWSWFWVFSPLFIGFGLAAVLMVVIMAIALYSRRI